MTRPIRNRVDKLAAELQAALGDNLVAFCLYGPAVRQDVPRARRELTTLLILRDVSPAALRPIERSIGDWMRRGNPPPLVFGEDGWRRSADVFPIEIEDMREAHVLLCGRSPFDGLETTRDDLRRELEREARGKLLRLRTEFVAGAADAKALEALLVESAGTFFILFRAALRLVGEVPPQEPAALVDAVARAAALDAEAFRWVLGKVAGARVRKLQRYDPAGDRYLEQMEQFVRFVDAWSG